MTRTAIALAAALATLALPAAAQSVNEVRRANGLAPLERIDKLDRAAARQAAAMRKAGAISHTGADGSSFSARLRAVGCSGGAENVAMGDFGGEAGVVAGWMDSPPHRKNLLTQGLESYGIAQDGRYWALVLGRGC
ncbi:CAP domain-containing protein [Palleronia sediminis]|uniref:CAP domain-containing protein n=1 Tax=Palleronia sediminis TaxID=2547833 RepID=A0A4R6A0R9_9RHOB|nr:CAP domain-containing protein [Palleronia sediminis]TDL75977.1 CAP domain-containing protein [Palleronia sediminis]